MSYLEITGLKKTYSTRLGSNKVEALKKDAATDFMFGTAAKYEGWKPGDGADGGKPGSTKKLSEMSYSELADYLAKNPDAKLD